MACVRECLHKQLVVLGFGWTATDGSLCGGHLASLTPTCPHELRATLTTATSKLILTVRKPPPP
eukprot:1168535-Amphidinium_carterae.1